MDTQENTTSHRFYRIFEEAFVVLLIAVVTSGTVFHVFGFTQNIPGALFIGNAYSTFFRIPKESGRSTSRKTEQKVRREHDPVDRIAARLKKRLRHENIFLPQAAARAAIEHRRELLRLATTVRVYRAGIEKEWQVSTQKYPSLIQPVKGSATFTFALDEAALQLLLQSQGVGELIPPQHSVLTAVEERANGILRVEAEGIAKPGEVLDPEEATARIVQAMHTASGSVQIAIRVEPGQVINTTGVDLGDITLLSSGKSNFQYSDYGRTQNIRKALEQHVNNVLIPPGATFSFNETLEGPVTQSRGWHMAKIIVNGADLELAPGGGICQASTTVFRAMLNAGFVASERKAHSLYVSYYEKHGVGIDATIFPGAQDLTFINDTESYLLMQSYADGDDAYVHIYGTPDGRSAELIGPYFSTTAPPDFRYKGRKLSKREIVWIQKVTRADGTVVEHPIYSWYRTMPIYYLTKKYGEKEIMHASAE